MKAITESKVKKEYEKTRVALKRAALNLDIDKALELREKMNDLFYLLGACTGVSVNTVHLIELVEQYDYLRET